MNSALFRLVRLVGGHKPAEGFAAVFVCYLDDSDAEQSSVITLAGYIQSLVDWEKFESHAEAVCREYGVDVLHAKEFHGTKGCFEGWTYKKKSRFIEDLYSTSPDMLGISVSVGKANFRKRQKELGFAPSLSAYGYAFHQVATGFIHSKFSKKQIDEQGLSLVVETGHKNNGDLERTFHQIKKDPMHRGCLKSLSFSGKHESRAIQLADLYAFYSRRQSAKVDALPRDASEAVIQAGQEKMFSLITFQCPHIISGNRDFYTDNSEIEKIVKDVEEGRTHGRHIYFNAQKPEDP